MIIGSRFVRFVKNKIDAPWYWHIVGWFIFSRRTKQAFLDGYHWGWQEQKQMPDYYNPESALNDYEYRRLEDLWPSGYK